MISRHIWNKSSKHAPVISIGWLLFPNENGAASDRSSNAAALRIRLSGVVDLALAAWMFTDLPDTALWAPGLLLGANMILGGIAFLLRASRAPLSVGLHLQQGRRMTMRLDPCQSNVSYHPPYWSDVEVIEAALYGGACVVKFYRCAARPNGKNAGTEGVLGQSYPRENAQSRSGSRSCDCVAGCVSRVPGIRPERRRLGFVRASRRTVVRSSDRPIRGCTAVIKAGERILAQLVAAYNNRGLAFRANGDLDRAIEDYDQAIRLMPDHHVAIGNRGVALMAKGELDRAITDFDRAIRLRSDYLAAFGARAEAHRRKSLFERAIADLDVVIKAVPTDPAPIRERGTMKAKMGDAAGAEADFRRAEALTSGGAAQERPR